MRCGKSNHFTNYCKSKQEIKAMKELAFGDEQKSDTSSEGSDESTCTLKTVNPIGNSDKRPTRKMLINGASVKVLPDSGDTVSAMDEATFGRYGLEEEVTIKKQDARQSRMAQLKRQTSYPYWAALRRSPSLRPK